MLNTSKRVSRQYTAKPRVMTIEPLGDGITALSGAGRNLVSSALQQDSVNRKYQVGGRA